MQDSRSRARVMIVGCGVIAQIKYVPALRRLSDLFDVVAVVNRSPGPRRFVSQLFPGSATFAEVPSNLGDIGLDAALVLTEPFIRPSIVEQCLAGGIHVLAEKPLALTSELAAGLVSAAARAGRVLLVAHTRRFDAGYDRLIDALAGIEVITASAVTLEVPYQPVVRLAALARRPDLRLEIDRPLATAEAAVIASALGTDDERVLRYYRWVLAESVVHDLDLLASSLGPVVSLDHASFSDRGVALMGVLRFGKTLTSLQWTLAPDVTRYDQRFEFVAADRRLMLRYPSPFLPNAPATLTVDRGSGQGTGYETHIVVPTYEDAFVRLLRRFADAVAGRVTVPDASDAVDSLRLAEDIARAQLRA